MLNVTVLAVGGLKEKYFTDACAEYQKRLGAFCKLRVIEVDEFKLGTNPSAAEIEKCVSAEGQSILARLDPKAFAIPLCIEGAQLDSMEFSEKIEKLSVVNSQLAFIIGGSHGLSRKVKERSGFLLSMSKLTFPHQLARVMLLEQIYRAFSISNGRKYHK